MLSQGVNVCSLTDAATVFGGLIGLVVAVPAVYSSSGMVLGKHLLESFGDILLDVHNFLGRLVLLLAWGVQIRVLSLFLVLTVFLVELSVHFKV